MMDERDLGRFEGMVIERLDALGEKVDTLRQEFIGFRGDVYSRINKNSQDIARQKGIIGVISLIGGFLAGLVPGLIGLFRRG